VIEEREVDMYTVAPTRIVARPTAVVRGKVPFAEISSFVAHAFGSVAAYLERLDVPVTGMPFGRFRHLGEGEFEVEAGFPVDTPIEAEGEVEPSSLPGSPAVGTWHVGPYDRIGLAHEAVLGWIERHGFEPEGPAWEVYYTDPHLQPDPSEWRTEVIQAYR
jgi:effector-binding domain-containing protein